MPFYVLSLGGEKRPPTPLVFDFFFSFFGLQGIQRPMSYSQCPKIILIEFNCFSEGGWVERDYLVVKVTF